MKDYYKTLGVEENITPANLKKTYHQLAQQYHPDKNAGDEKAAEQFKNISEAYATLGDPTKRAEYDAQRSGGSFGGGGLGDFFSNVFGSMRSHYRPPADPTVNLNISLSDLKNGEAHRILEFDNSVPCAPCAGRGGDDTAPCTTCHGQGRMQQSSRQGNSFFQRIVNCSACQGHGKIILNPCTHCRGQGNVLKREAYHISIKTTVKN